MVQSADTTLDRQAPESEAPEGRRASGAVRWALAGFGAVALAVSIGAALQLDPQFLRSDRDAAEAAAPVLVPVPPPQAPADSSPLIGPPSAAAAEAVDVIPLLPPRPLTVRDRAVARSLPGEGAGRVVATIRPGEPLRVIGRATQPSTGLWLQIRTDDGGVAFVDGRLALETSDWRRAERAARAAEEALSAAVAVQEGAEVRGAPLFGPSRPAKPVDDARTNPEPGQLY